MSDDMIYFEDLVVGTKQAYGRYEVTREEVIEFATKYDPQPFHLDDDAAAQTHFGRLSASGWHTCAMVKAMLVENFMGQKSAGLGSPGLEDLKWKKPVYPGDTLRVESELIEKRRSQSRPEMGLTKTWIQVFNQNDQMVMESTNIGLMQVRDPEAGLDV